MQKSINIVEDVLFGDFEVVVEVMSALQDVVCDSVVADHFVLRE